MYNSTADSSEHLIETSPVILHWMYSLLLDMGGCGQFVDGDGFRDADIAQALGVLSLAEAPISNTTSNIGTRARRHVRKMKPSGQTFLQHVTCVLEYQRADSLKQTPTQIVPEPLRSNVQQLGELVGLDKLEQKILAFCALLATNTMLYECCEYVGPVSFNKMLRMLANLLEQPIILIRERLSRAGTLVQAGLIEPLSRQGHRSELGDLLQPKSMDLAFQLLHYRGDPVGLFAEAFRPAPAGRMSCENYQHLGPMLGMASEYLRNALTTRRLGVNVLLYGPPGTGKSELTRLLASRLEAELFEVSCTDDDGDPIDGLGRLSALRSAMCVLAKRRALLVMDEIEDLFGTTEGFLAMFDDRPSHKGWSNRMLEENPLPCFWLTNNIDALDNAYIRRFDLILKLDNPTRAQRLRLVKEASSGRVNELLASSFAEHAQLTPAVVTRAIAVADSIAEPTSDISTTVEYLVEATLAAQGFPPLASNGYDTLPPYYSPEQINSDHSLEDLIEGLRQHSDARLCFYGPSGTGKTAFGLWIARRLGRPLYSRRASDLISPYMGMTERNFAAAFQAAASDNAVLFLDEVDTFLRDRRRAQHSWEVSAVNEMLTQMDAYRGVFIASTNLLENLDQASLRRFDLRIRFDFLNKEQISMLLDPYLAAMGFRRPATLALARLLRQQHVTPGDFAAVSRRARFKPFESASQAIEAVIAEAASKGYKSQRPMGFIH